MPNHKLHITYKRVFFDVEHSTSPLQVENPTSSLGKRPKVCRKNAESYCLLGRLKERQPKLKAVKTPWERKGVVER